MNSWALGRRLLADRAGGPGPSDRPRPDDGWGHQPFATAIDIRDMTNWKAEQRAILGPKRSTFAGAGAALSYRNRYCQQGHAILEHRSRHNRSPFHEPKLRSRTGIGAFVADHFRQGDIGLRRRQMNKFDSLWLHLGLLLNPVYAEK